MGREKGDEAIDKVLEPLNFCFSTIPFSLSDSFILKQLNLIGIISIENLFNS